MEIILRKKVSLAHLVNKLLDSVLKERHQLKPDVHQLVGTHDRLGVLHPALTERTSLGLDTAELEQILLLLVVVRGALVQSDVHKVHGSLIQHRLGLVETVLCAAVVVLVPRQDVH